MNVCHFTKKTINTCNFQQLYGFYPYYSIMSSYFMPISASVCTCILAPYYMSFITRNRNMKHLLYSLISKMDGSINCRNYVCKLMIKYFFSLRWPTHIIVGCTFEFSLVTKLFVLFYHEDMSQCLYL